MNHRAFYFGDVLLARPIARYEPCLFLAAKSSGNFAQLFVLLLPAGFEGPGEDLLKMIAIVHGGVKKNNVGALFRPT